MKKELKKLIYVTSVLFLVWGRLGVESYGKYYPLDSKDKKEAIEFKSNKKKKKKIYS